jgi:hypothetical protein
VVGRAFTAGFARLERIKHASAGTLAMPAQGRGDALHEIGLRTCSAAYLRLSSQNTSDVLSLHVSTFAVAYCAFAS